MTISKVFVVLNDLMEGNINILKEVTMEPKFLQENNKIEPASQRAIINRTSWVCSLMLGGMDANNQRA